MCRQKQEVLIGKKIDMESYGGVTELYGEFLIVEIIMNTFNSFGMKSAERCPIEDLASRKCPQDIFS